MFEPYYLDFWPDPVPGSLPLDSGGGDIEVAGGFASVASMAVSFVAKLIFWNLVFFKYTRARPGL